MCCRAPHNGTGDISHHGLGDTNLLVGVTVHTGIWSPKPQRMDTVLTGGLCLYTSLLRDSITDGV